MRRKFPSFILDLGIAGKGTRDCGRHDSYNAGEGLERCYHCEVGVRPYDPAHFRR